MEGLSGSRFSDVLRGDEATPTIIARRSAQGNALTNIGLISGLQSSPRRRRHFGFGTGNIILGGDGSDLIEGRGGDDLIDGDKWLNVRISVRANIDGTGPEIASYDSMVPMIPLMLNGTYNPGQLVAVRELKDGVGGFDTANYRGPPGELHDLRQQQRHADQFRGRRRHRDRHQRDAPAMGPTASRISSGCNSPISR